MLVASFSWIRLVFFFDLSEVRRCCRCPGWKDKLDVIHEDSQRDEARPRQVESTVEIEFKILGFYPVSDVDLTGLKIERVFFVFSQMALFKKSRMYGVEGRMVEVASTYLSPGPCGFSSSLVLIALNLWFLDYLQ